MKLTVVNAQRGTRMIRALYARTDPAMARMYERPGVTCLPGCASCCTLLNVVTFAEALVLADHIVSTRSAADVEVLRAKIDRHIEAYFPEPTPELTRYSHFNREVPCTLLGTDKRCTAYAARPAVCRYHFAVSDPEQCGPAPDGKPREVRWLNLEPYKMQVFSLAAGLHPGVPGAYGPLEVMLWWALVHRVEGGAAFGQAYENPYYAGRRFERWLEWTTQLDTAKKKFLTQDGRELAPPLPMAPPR